MATMFPPSPTPTDAPDSPASQHDGRSPRARAHLKSSIFNNPDLDASPRARASAMEPATSDPHVDAAIPAITTDAISQDVAPFLSKHIPKQYAPQGDPKQYAQQGSPDQHKKNAPLLPPDAGNTKYCYRHRPDVKCRRPADEPTMEQLQSSMERLPQADRQAVTHVWSLFSAAPAAMRKMMLQGILQQCCFPQLSFVSAQTRDLLRIDFLTALPAEISYQILSYLDTASLCKAAQVCRSWHELADDDVVWHKMCEQHIDRKCDKCGWGIPLLERKRLRDTKHEMELRARKPHLFKSTSNTSEITAGTSVLNIHGKRSAEPSDSESDASRSASPAKRPCPIARNSDFNQRKRPWKDVYSERFKVEANWRHGRCNTKIFRGHSDGIMCVQFDEHILATGSYDCTIKIWNLETGAEIRTLKGHTSGVRALQFDDTKLISGSMDHTIKIWNYRTGECISTLNGHDDGIVCLHFDDTMLVSGSVDHTIRVWNFVDRSCITLRGHTDWVNSVRLDTDSRTIFSTSDDRTVRMWDLDTRTCIRVFTGHVGHVQQVVFLPGSDSSAPHLSARKPPPPTIATAALDSTVKFWDVASGKCTKTLFGHVEGVWALAADSLRVISGAQDAMLKVWDVKSGRCERTITGHQGPVTCVCLGDSRMVTGGEDGEARIYCFKNCDKSGAVRIVGSCGENSG